MKTRIFLALGLISLILLNPACKKEEIDYTYDILDIQWADDGLDFDQDGYITSRNLQFSVSLLEKETRDIEIKVYYKLSETKEYVFYSSTDIVGVVGGENTPVLIKLGLNPELTKGMYSFLIEVYETDNNRIEASKEIENMLFERLATDQNYELEAWWTDQYDYDFDEFPRSANLHINVNVTNEVKKNVKVEVLYKKALIDSAYTSYFKSDYYEISAADDDVIVVETDDLPRDMGQGPYDFKIIVMEKNVFSPVLIYDGELASSLNLVPFESEWEDFYHYSLNLENTKWVQEVDADGDGFVVSRILRLDMDIEKDETVSIKAKVYRRPVIREIDEDNDDDDDDFVLIDSTKYFQISGASISDTIWLPIGNYIADSTLMMDSAKWEIMLSIFEVVPNDTIEFRYAIDSIDNTFFRNLKFELGLEDI